VVTVWSDLRAERQPVGVAVSAEQVSFGRPRVFAPSQPTAAEPAPRVTTASLVLGAWAAGFSVSLLILAVGGVRLARLASRSRRVADGMWIETADHIGEAFGLRRRAILLESDHPRWLITWGLLQPKVLLPLSARRWPADRVRLVLYHELAHVRRGDWIVQLAAELLRCAQWFNPLVWIACARLRRESEQACDDAVLAHGVEGSEYATHLVEIARDLRHSRMWTPAPAMARPSNLERRITAMLNHRLNRHPVSFVARAATLAATLAVTIAIAGLAAAQTFSTLAGSIVDPMNAVLPAVTVTLTNVGTKARYEVHTDHTGRYEFVGLPPGEYGLETALAGFRAHKTNVVVAGQNPMEPGERRSLDARLLKRPARCPDTPGGNALRIGGNIRTPRKIHDVRPIYPASLRNAAAAGTVVLHARIGPEGNVDDVTVVSSTHDDFTTSAIDAVRQWEFDPTLLNCVAIDVEMTVTLNFSYRP
jgi:TonB family protein